MALTAEELARTPQQWADLGKMGRAKQATERAGQTWSTDLHKTLKAPSRERQEQYDADTKKWQDAVFSPSGFTDIYRRGSENEIRGPEYGIPDVDIHGYPTDWNVVSGERDGESGQWITTAENQRYFKPTIDRDEGGGGGGDGGDSIVVQPLNRETPDLAELTDEMMLSNKVTELINRDSPLYRAAMTKAMQRGQARGILDSSINRGEVEKAIMSVALPIAQAEVQALQQNLYYNTDWTNKDKFMANEAAYNRMLTQLQGSINMTLQKFISGQQYGLQQLVGQQQYGMQQLAGQQKTALQQLMGTQATGLQQLVGAQELNIQQNKLKADVWSKYGDWITKMATTEGADQDAWRKMLDMLKGSGGWPAVT